MMIGENSSILNEKIYGKHDERVKKKFIFFGQVILEQQTEDFYCDSEIRYRIGLTKYAFREKQGIF